MVFRTARELGALIRSRRKLLRMNQQELALKTGVGRDWIVQLEKGKPTVELTLVLRTLRTLGLQLQTTEETSLREDEFDLDEFLSDGKGKVAK